MYTIGQLVSILNAGYAGTHQAYVVRHLLTDSRRIAFASDSLFFALKSKRRNGHQFIQDAYNQGVRSFVVSEPAEAPGADAAMLLVPDTLQALQKLAAFHRGLFSYPVLGITGSNGKTIVKEWLYQLLHTDMPVVRSPKSYNSQIGVPLSLWQMNANHRLAILEAGISKPDEMAALQQMIRPTLGIFTNLGEAHNEGFLSQQQKLEEKLKLFQDVEMLVCRGDNSAIVLAAKVKGIACFTWGAGAENNVRIQEVIPHQNGCSIRVCCAGNQQLLHIPFADDASVENVMHCVSCLLYLKYSLATIATRVSQLHGVDMRLQWKKGLANSLLLNDSYSNDLGSLLIALDCLAQEQSGRTKAAVLSDIAEAGTPDEILYTNVADLLVQKGVKQVVIVGRHISTFEHLFLNKGLPCMAVPDTAALLAACTPANFAGQSVLIKGARSFGLEALVGMLEEKTHKTRLEINLTSLAHNLNVYKALLPPHTRLMAMVKAFGYGSGDAEVARVLQHAGVDYLAVAYTDEGVSLRKAGIQLPVMVMNAEPETFALLEEFQLEPEIFSLDILRQFQRFADSLGLTDYPVHIKLDTGMHRLGFLQHEWQHLAKEVAATTCLKVKSVFTHLVASEDPEQDDYTAIQIEAFTNGCGLLEQILGYTFLRHAANTAAISRHPRARFDMVRLGIGLYGVDSNMKGLQVVTRLLSTVAQVKQLKAGDAVGYNRAGIMLHDGVVATVRIGYADGYRRQLGKGVGVMYIHGKPAPVIGNVCMDMTMLDVTDLPGVAEGDEVEVFGQHTAVRQLAQACGTIPYEILTGISQRVNRVYLQE